MLFRSSNSYWPATTGTSQPNWSTNCRLRSRNIDAASGSASEQPWGIWIMTLAPLVVHAKEAGGAAARDRQTLCTDIAGNDEAGAPRHISQLGAAAQAEQLPKVSHRSARKSVVYGKSV